MAQGLDINQVIAYNLMRVRKALGLSQDQAAGRLEPYLGVRWSKAVYSAAERSYAGKRIRQFTAADVAAFTVAFQVPQLYFFMPPKPEDRTAAGVMIGERFVAWPDLLDVMLDGKQQSALQLRLIELPPYEWPKNRAYLAALGLGDAEQLLADAGAEAATLISPAGEVSRYVRGSGKWVPAPPIVCAIVTSDRGVLISRRNDGDPPWGFIAGEQDVVRDDLPENTAVRETKEEARLEVEAGAVIGELPRHPRTGRHVIYVAATPIHGTDVSNGDPAELAEVKWARLSEALELLPDMFPRVRDYLERTLGEG